MQIVIEIDEKTYAIAKRHGLYGYPHLSRAIANGKPLPKGHGRLIDADAIQQYCFNKNFDKRLSDEGLAIINFYLIFQPTIIEGSDAE